MVDAASETPFLLAYGSPFNETYAERLDCMKFEPFNVLSKAVTEHEIQFTHLICHCQVLQYPNASFRTYHIVEETEIHLPSCSSYSVFSLIVIEVSV